MKRLARITQDHPDTDLPTARRIIGQAAAFLAASAALPGAQLSPSKAVDAGWHTFILHTVSYAEFCVASRFIHHVPTPNAETDKESAAARTRTLDAITTAGYRIDHDLWPDTAKMGNSSQCHAGCSDSPNSGTK
ncbi:glycine-rich domain-containing protein [Streptomyces globisporus]|uniref:glycine-rich domain-containing protein n=1 Tax=Streptomyces globisporus TaxID=1908 RepID=UPI0037BD0A1D